MIGKLVHYHTADYPHSTKVDKLAAIITGLNNDGSVNLAIFTHSGIALNHIYISKGTTYGCWSEIPTTEIEDEE